MTRTRYDPMINRQQAYTRLTSGSKRGLARRAPGNVRSGSKAGVTPAHAHARISPISRPSLAHPALRRGANFRPCHSYAPAVTVSAISSYSENARIFGEGRGPAG